MLKIKSIIPEGTRDFTTDECNRRKKVIEVISSVFSKWGYREIATPTIEYYETFNHKTQSLKEEEMYKFFDDRGKILVLRPDMTVPVARMINTKLKDVELPIKLFYTANVFRVHKSFGGNKNEYLDCGIELVGGNSNIFDLEVLVTALESLKSIGTAKFKIEVGNVNILKAVLDELDLVADQKEELTELINKKSLTNLREFVDNLNISEEHKAFFNKLPWMFGGYEMIEKVKEFNFNKEMMESVEYLEKLYLDLKELGYENYITVDISMVPRVNYYSGIIFKGYINGIGSTVLRGGRYDKLSENFGQDMEAIGFSIDVNSLINHIEYKEEITEKRIIKRSMGIEGLKEAIEETRKGGGIKFIYDK